MILITAIFTDQADVKLAVGLLNKLAIVGCFNICFVYSSEIFPTPLRSAAVGVSSTAARVGAVIAPFVPLLVCCLMLYIILYNVLDSFSKMAVKSNWHLGSFGLRICVA